MIARDRAILHPVWTIDKFLPESNEKAELLEILGREGFPIEKLKERFSKEYRGQMRFEGNCFLNTGINSIAWPLIIGSGGTALGASSYLGVGTSSTAANAATQTGLLADAVFVVMDGTYPLGPTAQVVSWRSTFGAAVANQNWNEICISNNNTNASGTVLNRLVQVMGTKASPAVWLPTLQITLA